MKLLSVHVENFGRLHDYDRDFSDGINRITEDNGWGKTTLSVFILVMFYGFDDKITKKLREKYAPWNGGVFGGSVIFESGGKIYMIERIFGPKKSTEDRFILRDAETNLKSDDYDEYIGDELFKINTESFMKTVFIGSNGCVTGITDDINAKIGDLSPVDSDMRSYTAAQEAIKDYLNKNSDTRKTGRIYDMKEELTELQSKARFAPGIRNELRDLDESLRALAVEKEEASETKDSLTALQTQIVRCKEAVLTYEKYKVLNAGVETALKLKEEPYAESQAPSLVLYAIGSLAGILGIVVAVTQSLIFGLSALVAGICMLVAGIVTAFKREKRRAAYEEAREKAFKAAENEFKSFMDSVDLKEAIRLSAMPEATRSLKDTDRKRAEIIERLDKIQKEIQKAETRREFLCDELTSSESAELKAGEKEKEIGESLRKLSNAKKASEFLFDAKVNFALRYLEPLKRSLGTYYTVMTGQNGAKCRLDANLSLTVEEEGAQRQEDSLSDGLRDALGLCMRFALIDAMYVEEKPFVIMDDPFLHFDSKTEAAANELIKQLPYQIILMQRT